MKMKKRRMKRMEMMKILMSSAGKVKEKIKMINVHQIRVQGSGKLKIILIN